MNGEIDVVDQQVEGAAGLPNAPRRGGAAAAEHGGAERAEAAVEEGVAERDVFGPEADHLRGHENAAALLGLGDDAVGGGAVERHRLLDEDVLAGAQGVDGDALVQSGGKADIDCVDIGVGEQVGDARGVWRRP